MEKLALEYADAMTQTPWSSRGAVCQLREKFTDAQLGGTYGDSGLRTTGRGLTMRSEWKPKVLQGEATARYQCARRVRLRFIPRVEALSLARNRLLVILARRDSEDLRKI